VEAESLPITSETSAKDFTGRVKVRTSGEKRFAGRLRAKGNRVGLNPVGVWRLFRDDVDDLNGEGRKDKDKRARPNEKLTANAIETAEADRVFHYFPFLNVQAKPLSCASLIILAHSWAVRFLWMTSRDFS